MTTSAIHKSANSRVDRRQQLIDAAIVAIAQNGLSRATVSRVASIANLSPGIVNFYFQSKDALLLAALRYLTEEYMAAVSSVIKEHRADPVSSLHAIIDLTFDPVFSDVNKVAVWYAFWGESQAREEYTALCSEKDIEFHGIIFDLFQDMVNQNGQMQMDANALARGFEGLLDGLWQELLADPSSFDRSSAKKTCRRYLSSLFPAIENKPNYKTLAPWTYQNRELLELEVETIFRRNWCFVGHANEIPNAGDYLTFKALGEHVVVIRGSDKVIRAFHNVCRHRGSRVVEQARGHCKNAIVCPFHGWTYRLDGSLKNIPRPETFENLDKDDHGLKAVELEEWMGLLFIRFESGGQSITDYLQPAMFELKHYRLTELQPLHPIEREVQAVNWKLIHDVDNEGYHVPIGHPGLHSLYGHDYEDKDFGNGVYASYGRIHKQLSRHWGVARYQTILPRFEYLPEHLQRTWFYVGVFPNHSFGFYPDCMDFFQTIPVDVDKTIYVYGVYALPDDRREVTAARYLNMRINQQVMLEDLNFAQWMQENLSSSVFPRNVLSSIEEGVSSAHQDLIDLIPVMGSEKEPSKGRLREINQTMRNKRV